MNPKPDEDQTFEEVDPLQELEQGIRGHGMDWRQLIGVAVVTVFAAIYLLRAFDSTQFFAIMMTITAICLWTSGWDRRSSEGERWRKTIALLRTYSKEIQELRAAKK